MTASQPIDRLAETLQRAQRADKASLDDARKALDLLATDPNSTSAVLALAARAEQLIEALRSEEGDAASAELARLQAEVSRYRSHRPPGADEEARAVARRDIADRLERAERALLNITSPRPGDDRLDTVFRSVLAIRSAARAVGLTAIADLAHSVEDLLDAARRREIVLARQHLDLALEACDVIAAMLDESAATDAPSPQSVRGLLGALRHASAGGDLRTTASAVSDGVARIGQVLIDLGVADADRVNEALSAQRSGVHVLAERLRHAGLENAEAIEDQLLQGGPLAVAIERMITRLDVIEASRLHDAVQQARASGRRLGELLDLNDADLVQVMREQRRRRRAARGGLPPARPALDAASPDKADAATEPPEVAPASTVRVSGARVDALTLALDALDATFESLAADPAFSRVASASVIDSLGLLGEQIRAARLAADSIRVTPLSTVLERMPRIAHDVAASAGVDVELRIDADNIELDRRVAAQLVDPIIHLVRNACDHAIEAPDQRASAGKARAGVVRIHAHREGRSVIISVRDDGRGVDRSAVIERAIERGILAPDIDAESLSDSDVYELLFLPGFTTMRHAGEYSGHGVGLDVVQQHVVALGGAIEVESTSGVGACFTLRVPDPPLEALPPRR